MLRLSMIAFALMAWNAPLAVAETPDELVAKHLEAKGGVEKLKSLNTMRMTGKMTLPNGMEAPFVMMAKRPDRSRIEFTIQGLMGVQAYDGKNAWMRMPFMGKKEPELMAAEESKAIEEQADFDGPLVDYKSKGHTLELIGKEKFEGSDAYKLKITLKKGEPRILYLDAEHFLEIGGEGKRTIRGTEVEGVSTMGDYKEVDGVMLAHSISSGMKGQPERQTITIEKVELNVPLPDTLFDTPAGARLPGGMPAKADSSAKADSTAKPAKGDSVAAAKPAPPAKKQGQPAKPKKP